MPLGPEGPCRRPAVRRGVAVALVISSLAGCPEGDPPDDDEAGAGTSGSTASAEAIAAEVRAPEGVAVVVEGGSGAELAAATSETLFVSAPVVVLAAEDDPAAHVAAAPAAVGLGVPLLLTPGPAAEGEDDDDDGAGGDDAAGPVADELARLAPEAVLAVGDGAAAWAEDDSPAGEVVTTPADAEALAAAAGLPSGDATEVTGDEAVEQVAGLTEDDPTPLTLADPDEPSTETTGTDTTGAGRGELLVATAPGAALEDVAVLVGRRPDGVAAAATARAAGAHVVPAGHPDPRADPAAIEALSGREFAHVVGVGAQFGPAERLWQRARVAATGVELPGGGQVLFPGRRMAALYGNPTTAALGVLGEQPLEESIARAEGLAAQYDELVHEPVVPAFELIATVASSAPGPDGNYANESEVEELRPWIDAAGEAGVYVVLDIQPGRTDFLTQARRYQDLLAEPHVGLALDPEWRLGPDQVHMDQIGSIAADEVNQVAEWLADLTLTYDLPQKLLLLHQFRTDMLRDRDRIRTDHDELAVLVHADGFGTPGQKFETWDRLQQSPPANIWWGWKNFVDEDRPMFTPAQTTAIEPSPMFVSYQ